MSFVPFVRQFLAHSRPIFSISASKSVTRYNQREIATSKMLYAKKEINITFIYADGRKTTVKGEIGETLIDTAIKNNIVKENGICDGLFECFRCTFIFTKQDFDKLPKPYYEEDDLLKWCEYPEMSRMGCQIEITEDLDGIEVEVPEFPKI